MKTSDGVIVIGSAGVKVFVAGKHQEMKEDYPQGLLVNQDVEDIEAYKKWWTTLAKQTGLVGRRVMLVLGESILFFKKVTSKEDGDLFLKEVPLEEIIKSKKVVNIGQMYLAMAVNERLYKLAVDALEEIKCEVTGVWPEAVFGTKTLVGMLGEKKLTQENNFLQTESADEDEPEEKQVTKKSNKLLWLVWVALMIALGVSVFVVFFNKPKIKPVTTIAAVPETTATPTIASAVTPTPTKVIDTGKMKIVVLNASGKVGMAKVVAGYLTSLGYSDVGTGNSTQSATGYVVSVKGRSELAVKLVAQLSEKYGQATEGAGLLENATSDAVVVIGK
jgi:hypothetical protein